MHSSITVRLTNSNIAIDTLWWNSFVIQHALHSNNFTDLIIPVYCWTPLKLKNTNNICTLKACMYGINGIWPYSFRGRKLLRISRICAVPWKFSPRVFWGVACMRMRALCQWPHPCRLVRLKPIRESFLPRKFSTIRYNIPKVELGGDNVSHNSMHAEIFFMKETFCSYVAVVHLFIMCRTGGCYYIDCTVHDHWPPNFT